MRAPEAFPASLLVRSSLLLALIASEASAQSWLDTVVEISKLSALGEYAEAVELGQQLIELAGREYGESSRQLAEAHLILAENQIASGDTESGEESALRALAIYERIEGAQSPALVDVYLFLGDAHTAAGWHPKALEAYTKARDLARRNHGLDSPEQIESMWKMSNSLHAMGVREDAVALQREILDIFGRSHDMLSFAAGELALQVGEWLRERDYHADAAEQYSTVATIQNRFGDPSQTARFRLLMAEQYRLAGRESRRDKYPPSYSALVRSLQTLESIPENQPLLRAELYRELADATIVFGEPMFIVERAYDAAWDMLALVEGGEGIRDEWFSEPVPVHLAPWESDVLSDDEDAPTGYVELRFAVDANGVARDVEVVAAEPADLLNKEAIQRTDHSRFRPRVVDGSVVEATTSIRFEFSYDPALAEK